MDSLVQAKVAAFLRNRFQIDPVDCTAVLKKMRELARAAGHGLDTQFAASGLGSGPEGRVASSIVERALGGGGSATAEKDIRLTLERWIRNSPPVGA